MWSEEFSEKLKGFPISTNLSVKNFNVISIREIGRMKKSSSLNDFKCIHAVKGNL